MLCAPAKHRFCRESWLWGYFWLVWQGSVVRGQVVVLGAGPDNCRMIGGKCKLLFSFVSQAGGRAGASSCSSGARPAGAEQTQAQVSVRGRRKAEKRCFAKPQPAAEGTGLNPVLAVLLLPLFPKYSSCLVLGFKPYF